MAGKYRKANWKYVQIKERDIELFQMILEQKFLRRTEVIECRERQECRQFGQGWGRWETAKDLDP